MKRYRDYIFKYTKEKNIYEGNTIIQKKLKDKSLTLQDMTHIDNIDDKMIAGMIKTEKQIKLRSQFHPWS